MMKIVRLEFGSGLLPPQIAAHLKRNHEDRKVSIEQKSEKAPLKRNARQLLDFAKHRSVEELEDRIR